MEHDKYLKASLKGLKKPTHCDLNHKPPELSASKSYISLLQEITYSGKSVTTTFYPVHCIFVVSYHFSDNIIIDLRLKKLLKQPELNAVCRKFAKFGIKPCISKNLCNNKFCVLCRCSTS